MNLVFKTFPDIRVGLSDFATKHFITCPLANNRLKANVKSGLVNWKQTGSFVQVSNLGLPFHLLESSVLFCFPCPLQPLAAEPPQWCHLHTSSHRAFLMVVLETLPSTGTKLSMRAWGDTPAALVWGRSMCLHANAGRTQQRKLKVTLVFLSGFDWSNNLPPKCHLTHSQD